MGWSLDGFGRSLVNLSGDQRGKIRRRQREEKNGEWKKRRKLLEERRKDILWRKRNKTAHAYKSRHTRTQIIPERDRQTERETERQTDTHTHTLTHTQTQTHTCKKHQSRINSLLSHAYTVYNNQ